MTPYWPLYLGLAAYAVFILVCIGIGFRGNTEPIRSFCVRHAKAAPVVAFIACAFAIHAGNSASQVAEGVAITLIYFFLAQYAVMIHPFAVAQRSVSTNLLLSLIRFGGRALPQQLKSDYGKGKSLSYVTESRLDQMERWGWIAGNASSVRATPRGTLRVRIAALLLGTLGLKPLAKP